jgi:LacI family gluconate utilization system Gnt-I transcriptional repressor
MPNSESPRDTGGPSGNSEFRAAHKPNRRSTMRPTLAQVAAHAGVAPQTVSRTLRAPHLVSPQTLERVQRSIAAVGYVPNLTASSLASNRTMTVAAIIPAISASIFADVLHGLDEALSAMGYHLFIGSTDYSPTREEELTRAFLGRRPDGFFIVGTSHTDATAQLLRSAGIPVVEGYSLTSDPIGSVVGFSNVDAIRGVVELIVAEGYQHPTFAGSLSAGDTRALERSYGFELAVSALLPDEPVRIVDSGSAEVDYDIGRILIRRVLAEHPVTDVVVFASDVFAAGAIFECAQDGVDVPGRVGITGFGDFEIARQISPGLTTVAVPNRAIGTEAGRLLIEAMSQPDFDPRRIDVGFDVVARDSTRRRS